MGRRLRKTAVWALTPGATALAVRIAEHWPGAIDLHISAKVAGAPAGSLRFARLTDSLAQHFHAYEQHIFVMAAGIVARLIAGLLIHKTRDPAVVVVDEKGRFAVSLIAGHVGGANQLAEQLGALIGALPVITTATDVNALPAVDCLAVENDLAIENPSAIKCVHMALLQGRPFRLQDPYGVLRRHLPADLIRPLDVESGSVLPGVFVDDVRIELPPDVLVLRPKSLVVGMGCNRGTAAEELKRLLLETLERFNLSFLSLRSLATIELKRDEAGLSALAADLDLEIEYFTRQSLSRVQNIQRPSAAVEKHIGVKSVCEAAAILASNRGNLIVPKQKTPNATVAVARIASMSSD